ncbi:hypothetical protein [Streptomyces omiyaensis]|uniref:Uncharacterized protein n=1 Tax=Streptomyces omiyaensis TaxID=68247 RepID=A0ABW7BVL9_9ACTN
MMLALAVQAVAMSALVLVDDGAGLTLVATIDQLAAALGATGPAFERWGARTRPRYARAAPEAAGAARA